jgi:hypothetical protein
MGDLIKYPFGAADQQAPAYAANIAATIKNQMTIIKPGTLTGALTLDLTIDSQVSVGARLLLVLTSDGTARTTTLGTGIDGPAIVGVINKTMSQEFCLDGDGVFKPVGSFAQVN